jgi:hypothetical protein
MFDFHFNAHFYFPESGSRKHFQDSRMRANYPQKYDFEEEISNCSIFASIHTSISLNQGQLKNSVQNWPAPLRPYLNLINFEISFRWLENALAVKWFALIRRQGRKTPIFWLPFEISDLVIRYSFLSLKQSDYVSHFCSVLNAKCHNFRWLLESISNMSRRQSNKK